MSTDVSVDFEDLLTYVRDSRGFDFTGYKRPSLQRRVLRRVEAVGVDGFAAYRDHLELHPDEYGELFNTILINVTSFFRDPPTWEFVAQEVIPRVAEQQGPIRVWSTGCASGEEAYTVAMLLAEELGEEDFRNRVKIYATDVDDEALTIGRHGSYSSKDLESVPEELRAKYFVQSDRVHTFRKELRRSVIFGRNDLVQDPPISRVDLLTSRNTLMYFTPETQGRVLANYYFSLRETGFLVLGKSEVLLTRSNLFAPVNLKRRVFEKVPRESLRERLLTFVERDGSGDGGVPAAELPAVSLVREAAFETSPSGQIVVSAEGILAAANQAARHLFSLSTSDVGRPLQDLEVSYRPIELRSLIEQAYTDGHAVSLRDIEWQTGGETRFLDVQVIPLTSPNGSRIGTSVAFNEVTRYRRLHDTLEHSRHELETAYEELQATAEELETTNEELQSTNEELETTNEELQSTNEELETMNEELQSTNEELETMNDELRRSSNELNQVNAFLESILGSLRGGVAVLDQKLRVVAWNAESTELWGVRADEAVDQHFLNLDIGLPVDQLHKPIRACLAGEEEHAVLELQATNRRGKPITCVVTCSPLRGDGSVIDGVILVMNGRPVEG